MNRSVFGNMIRRLWIPLVTAGALTACGQNLSLSVATGTSATLGSQRRIARQPLVESAAREHLIYTFRGSPDGESPNGGLISQPSESVLGTTAVGGLHEAKCGSGGCGTIFALTPSASRYSESVLYRFRGPMHGGDGDSPSAGLTAGPNGIYYGTTYSGGAGSLLDGTVYQLRRSAHGYTEKVIYRFPGHLDDGVTPYAGVVVDAAGTIYGDTSFGGQNNAGIVYALKPGSSGYSETVLHNFDFSDGAHPGATLTIDSRGNLYGAAGGGNRDCGNSGDGCGLIFKLSKSGSKYTYRVLHQFSRRDGWGPSGAALLDKEGALYGTTDKGGPHECGSAFRLTPKDHAYAYDIIYSFVCSAGNGFGPGPLSWGSGGVLYGTMVNGGLCLDCGTIFKLTPSATQYLFSAIYKFRTRHDGKLPTGVTADSSGMLYGTTASGPSRTLRFGTVFKIKQ